MNNSDSAKATGYPLFDWLRFVLASLVALGHAGLIAHSEITGNLAVQVFFSLSGWLIGAILLDSRLEQLPKFFFNRATRIWIPYFFAVCALYAVSATREPVTARWLEFLYYDLTFTHNWFSLRPNPTLALSEMPLKGTGNGFWSISVEEQFYLVAPLLILAIRFGRLPVFWALIAVTLWLLQLTDFASIGLGVLAAAIQQRHQNLHLRLVSVAGLLLTAFSSMLVLTQVSYPLGAPLFSVSIVLLCARPGTRGPVGIFAGAISYPMYLNHWMGMFLVNAIAKRADWLTEPALGIAGYFSAVIVGAVAYILIDRNVLTNREKFYSRKTGTVSASVAYALVIIGLFGGLMLGR